MPSQPPKLIEVEPIDDTRLIDDPARAAVNTHGDKYEDVIPRVVQTVDADLNKITGDKAAAQH
jgi:hypothetical protein